MGGALRQKQMDVFFAAFVLTVLSVGAEAAASFQIQPFWHTLNDGTYAISWQYPKEPVQVVPLEMPACDFGSLEFYQLPGMAKPAYLKNIPCNGTQDVVRFAFLADTQEGPKTTADFINIIDKMDNNALIFGGDFVQDGSDVDDWEEMLRAVNQATSHRLMIPVVGNHEYRGDNKTPNWKKYFGFDAGLAFYSTWIGPAKIIVINSSFEDDPTLVVRQLIWLDKELAHPAPWKIVVFHHPAYSRSIMYTSTFPKREYKFLRDLYLPLFEKYKVDLVLNGHSHIYERSFRNGIHYITTGAAGGKQGIRGADNPYEVLFDEARTYIQFEVSSTELRASALQMNSQPIDFLILKR